MILEAEYKAHQGGKLGYAYAKVDISIVGTSGLIIHWMDGQALNDYTECFWKTFAACVKDYPLEIKVLDFKIDEIDSSPNDFRFVALSIFDQFKEIWRN